MRATIEPAMSAGGPDTQTWTSSRRADYGRSDNSVKRVGEIRRGPNGERRYDPLADPRGDADVQSNRDNFNVPPGATHVLLDAQGPGVIIHIWITFLGPEPQNWAPRGSANHQELMLRMYWDGNPRPAVEAPVGEFFASCFGKRREVVSVPIVVEDGDFYNSYWQMPFRKSARIEIENQSDKPLSGERPEAGRLLVGFPGLFL